MVGYFDYKHACLVEKKVPIVFIFPVDGGMVSLGIERPQKLSMSVPTADLLFILFKFSCFAHV